MNDIEATQTRIIGNQNYLKDCVKNKIFTKQLIYSLEKHLLVKWVSIFFWFNNLIGDLLEKIALIQLQIIAAA